MSIARANFQAVSFEVAPVNAQRALEKLDDAVANCPCAVSVVTSRTNLDTLGEGARSGVVILRSDGQGDDIGYIMTMLTRRLEVPVLLYLLQQDEISELVGFRTGATDVLNSTMSRTVLTERITAAFRRRSDRGECEDRSTEASADERVALLADVDNNDFWIDDERIEMTLAEVKFLEVLISRRGAVVKREELVPILEGIGLSGYDRSVDNIVKRIRQKMRARGIEPGLIQTVYGSGYRLSPSVVSAFRAPRPRYS